MKSVLILIGAVAVMVAAAAEQKPFATSDPALQQVLDSAMAGAFARFETNKLATNQIAATLVDLQTPEASRVASFRGDAPIYPASVVKLFYLAAVHRWLADGKLHDSPELQRAMKDMIVESYNEATHYIVDVLTGTTSGPELPEAEMKVWSDKRNAVNRYFASLGYEKINANQKTWCEGPYGRERIWVGTNYSNRNALTTDATARLMSEIATSRCVSPAASEAMMKLLVRERGTKPGGSDSQAHGYTGKGLPSGAKLWSKAGWTSTSRHDAAYVELPDGRKFVLVVFTTGHATNREIIGFIAGQIVDALRSR